MKSYVNFIQDKDETQELVFDVENKSGEHLGRIYYYSKWRKFIFASDSCFYDSDCMNQIGSYLLWLTDTKKRGFLKEKS